MKRQVRSRLYLSSLSARSATVKNPPGQREEVTVAVATLAGFSEKVSIMATTKHLINRAYFHNARFGGAIW
jgi:hypothetical protein